jgi:hypothetical protein
VVTPSLRLEELGTAELEMAAPAALATTVETASASHAWLNRCVAVTRANSTGTRLTYTIMSVRI